MLITDASRRLWLPGTTRRTIKFEGSIRDWILNGGWSMSSVMTKKKIRISPHAIDEFTDASLNDAIRLGSAAFESAKSVQINHNEPRSCGWQSISYYYSGYFAANAIMRLCGHGCTNLSALECAEINERARLYGFGGTTDANKVVPGLYFSVMSSGSPATWDLHAASGKGGVHIQFWIGFLKFLANLETAVKASALVKSDKDATVQQIRDLMDSLKHGGAENGSWLSEVRNAMNYRLDYGVWHPYQGSCTDGPQLSRALSQTLAGASTLPSRSQAIPDPLRACRISAFLLTWLKELATLLKDDSGGRKRILIEDGIIAFSNAL